MGIRRLFARNNTIKFRSHAYCQALLSAHHTHVVAAPPAHDTRDIPKLAQLQSNLDFTAETCNEIVLAAPRLSRAQGGRRKALVASDQISLDRVLEFQPFRCTRMWYSISYHITC